MKIVIIGCGKVGTAITKWLLQEGHEIVVIDPQKNVLSELQESLDVAVISGNGASLEIQREANVASSDLLIAVTPSDEANLLCCMVAKKLGCNHTIARVRNPEYDQQTRFLKEELGLSMVVNPEKAAALEIFRLLQYPAFLKRDSFARGSVELIELIIGTGSILDGKKLSQFRNIANVNALVCAVDRNGSITIPNGDFTLLDGDKITIATDATDLTKLIHNLKIQSAKAEDIMIIGGSNTTKYLGQMLIKSKAHIIIIERDFERCHALSEALPEATIIHGNGSTQKLLIEEGLKDMDAVVTLTGIDEENLIISMFAEYLGVPKTVTKISRTEYSMVFNNKGIGSIVSPKTITANQIISYVRAMKSTTGGSIVTLYKIVEGKAEALEFIVKSGASFSGVPLSNLKIRNSVIVACIIRARRVIIPSGSDSMQEGDTVVIITKAGLAINDLNEILEDNE